MSQSNEIETLEAVSEMINQAMSIMMIVQLVMSTFFSAGFEFFMALIGSQQNLAYLPALTLNNPAQISMYLEVIVELIGFDPIPVDIFYEAVDLFDFEWTGVEPDGENLAPIGFEDRVFLLSLGSLFLFMLYYVFSQLIAGLIWVCSSHPKVKKIYNMLYIQTPKT